jgi:hypothetical protein
MGFDDSVTVQSATMQQTIWAIFRLESVRQKIQIKAITVSAQTQALALPSLPIP